MESRGREIALFKKFFHNCLEEQQIELWLAKYSSHSKQEIGFDLLRISGEGGCSKGEERRTALTFLLSAAF